MREILLLSPRVSDAANIVPLVPGTAHGSLGVGNLLRPQPSDVCRFYPSESTSPTVGVILDFGVPVTFDTAWLGYHTGTEDGTWKISAEGGSGMLDLPVGFDPQPLIPPGVNPEEWGGVTHSLQTFPPVSRRYWTVEIDDPGRYGQYIDVGRLILGLAYRPAQGVEYGAQHGVEEGVTTVYSQGGEVYKRGSRKRLWQKVSWTCFTQNEALEALRIGLECGSSQPVVLCTDLGRPFEHTVYGTMSTPVSFTVPAYSIYTIEMQVTEVPR